MPEEDAARTEQRFALVRRFIGAIPHNQALGMSATAISTDGVELEVPYKLELVGNPDTGVLHGGVITALLDAASGAAVFSLLEPLIPIATLDLRIDYLRPATPGQAVRARASCYKRTRTIAFTRAVAFHDDPDDPIAHSVGTFMLSTKHGATPR